MQCTFCNTIFCAAKCPACGRDLGSAVSRGDQGPRSWESVDSVIMDYEQRGLLIVTIFRDGGERLVHLLPPRR